MTLPRIRNGLCLEVNPEGCERNTRAQIAEAKACLLDESERITKTVWAGGVTAAVIPVEFIGYKLADTPFDPELPAQMEDGQTLNVYLVTDSDQTVDIIVDYHFDGLLDESERITKTVWAGGVTAAVIPVEFIGYKLADTPFDPELPAQMKDGQTLNVYLVTDSDQTVDIIVDYHFDGILDESERITKTVWAGGVTAAVIPVEFVGYKLADTPFDPELPAQMKNGQTLNVYLVTDSDQTVDIIVDYHFDGILDESERITKTVWAGGVTDRKSVV